jgi:hypothetical protein
MSFSEAPKAIDEVEKNIVKNLLEVRAIKRHVYTSVMYPLSHMIMANIRNIHKDLVLQNTAISERYCRICIKYDVLAKYLNLEMLGSNTDSAEYRFTFGSITHTYKSHAELCESMIAFLAHGFSSNGFYDAIYKSKY